jgi:hypothetical protein
MGAGGSTPWSSSGGSGRVSEVARSPSDLALAADEVFVAG